MPRAYRIMKSEGTTLRPVVGDSATKLGVRPKDLLPDAEGNALPGKGGMSVLPSIAGLRRRLAEKRFNPAAWCLGACTTSASCRPRLERIHCTYSASVMAFSNAVRLLRAADIAARHGY